MNETDHRGFYESWFERLRSIAIDEYHIGAADAGQLAHEVLLSSLHAARAGADTDLWMEATMRAASRCHVARKPPLEET